MNLLRSLVDPAVPRNIRLVRALLLALLALACAYRVWLIWHTNPAANVWSDPARHWYSGSRPAEATPMSAIDPILFQIYMAVLAKLTVQSPVLTAYWTALLSLSGPWLWYRFLRELLANRDWALAGWVILAGLPSWAAIYSYFMQETLMLPLLGAALWATWRCRRRRDTRSFVLAAALWLAAGLTRGVCLPMGAIALAWLWISHGNKLPRAALAVALLTLILVPLAGRSWSIARLISPHGSAKLAQLYHLAGTHSIHIVFTRRGGAERWVFESMSPSAEERPFAPLSDWQSPRVGTARFTIDLDAGSRDWQAAMAGLPALDMRRLAWLTGDNLIRLFFGNSWPEASLDTRIGVVNHWLRWVWVPLSVACLVLLWWQRRRVQDWLLPALILTWFVTQALFPLAPNEGRYRKPFEGLLVAQLLVLAHAATRSRNARRDDVAPSATPGQARSGHVYDDVFYRYQRDGSLRSARNVLPHVARMTPVTSALDVGCGTGAWLAVWKELGVQDVRGVDGGYVDRSRLLVDPARFTPLDISRSFDCGRRFDLVMCLEVAEHVPPSCSETLVANVVSHGDVVLFSAAAPGQGGESHINERPYEYWRDLFARHGYHMYDCVRPVLAGNPQIEPWYRYNMFLFVHDRRFHTLSPAAVSTRCAVGAPVPDRSPAVYRMRKALIRRLPPSVVTWLAVCKHRLAVRVVRNVEMPSRAS